VYYVRKANCYCEYVGERLSDLLYVVDSEYFRNHFISENYKTVQSFKPRFLQKSLLVQLYTLSGTVKLFGI
jgi:hypothetical protein